MNALSVMVDPNNHTRWKHKWHNREWDNLASECAGNEDWTEKRKLCTNKMYMRGVLTFGLTKVRHSVVHRPKIGEHVSTDKEKEKRGGKLARLTKQS